MRDSPVARADADVVARNRVDALSARARPHPPGTRRFHADPATADAPRGLLGLEPARPLAEWTAEQAAGMVAQLGRALPPEELRAALARVDRGERVTGLPSTANRPPRPASAA